MITKFNYFLYEHQGVNNEVKRLTRIVFNKIENEIFKNLDKKQFILTKVLENANSYYTNDTIEVNITDNTNCYFDYSNSSLVRHNITDVKFKFNLILTEEEIKNKKLNTSLYGDINHELNHANEIYYEMLNKYNIQNIHSVNNEIRSNHKNKYQNVKVWSDILHIHYLMSDSEINSRVSELYELLINSNITDKDELYSFYKKTDIYKDCKNISKLNVDFVIKKLEELHSKELLTEIFNNFIKIVKNKDIKDYDELKKNIISIINNIKEKSNYMLNKLNRVYYKAYNDIYKPNVKLTTENCFHNHNINFDDYLSLNDKIKMLQDNRKLKINKFDNE